MNCSLALYEATESWYFLWIKQRVALVDSVYGAGVLWRATRRMRPFSYNNMLPNDAPQMRVAFSSNVSKTGSKAARRTGDDLEHVGGGRLLLQRFGQIVGAPRNSLSSRVFSIAMTACAAKFCTSAICLSAKRSLPAVNDYRANQLIIVEQRNRNQVRMPASSIAATQRVSIEIRGSHASTTWTTGFGRRDDRPASFRDAARTAPASSR